tara:strand:+ start:3757 stop:5700 length:1944 start_codon:yes stop_codon:yes gene_type:complete
MENEKISGKITELQNESDSSKVVKDVEQAESKGQSGLNELGSSLLIHANEAQTESEVELELDTASESKVTDHSESALESKVSSDNNSLESVETFYQEICQKAEEFVLQPDWAFVSNELASLALKISEGPEPDSEGAKQAIAAFQILRDEFDDRKKTHYEELNKKRADNLERKKKILKKLSDLIETQNWTATKEIRSIQQLWEQIKLLPASEVDALNKRFDSLIQEFENHKVDRLVKKLQKEEENLTLKLLLLEKIKELNGKADHASADFAVLNTELQDLQNQWRKVGRVPLDRNQHTWDQFYATLDQFNELRYKHDASFRNSVEKALQKKQKLIKEAESLLDMEDLAEAARRVNKLHKLWKKTGNLPQKEENELWDAFKAATDAFNDKKSENLEELRAIEQKNYELKLALVRQAISIKDADNSDNGHQKMQDLMAEWKKIGPVPRKKSSKIWKQFKDIMDDFYNQRREHFKDVRKTHKENLKKKNELLEQLNLLVGHDDPAVAVQEAKKLQEMFKEIGHVPIKLKNKIWKDYREVCDKIYGNYRFSGPDLGMDRKLTSEGLDPSTRKEVIGIQKKLDAALKAISALEAEIIQFQEAKTYFKPTNKGNALLDDLDNKIATAKNKLDQKHAEAFELKKTIDLLKNKGSE